MKYIKRILSLPFVIILFFIGAIFIWISWTYDFIKHGGEIIPYTKEINGISIADVFIELQKQQMKPGDRVLKGVNEHYSKNDIRKYEDGW